MEQNDQVKTLWPEIPPEEKIKLDDQFVDQVVEQAHTKVLYRDILFLALLGFLNVCLGFLKIGGRRTQNDPKQEAKK